MAATGGKPPGYEAWVGRAALKPGEWIVVFASAGGVGTVAVQLATAFGAKASAVVGSPEKLNVSIRQGGADHSVNTNGKGVDVIYDPLGYIRGTPPFSIPLIKCIAWKGRVIVVGFAAVQIEKLALNLDLLKNISIRSSPHASRSSGKKLLNLFSFGCARLLVYPETFPLKQTAEGLLEIEQRKTESGYNATRGPRERG
ncbi:hypothetical protein C8Q76DRAFT_792247 [Earliella scabrosa]|nr:hypothetical protein C8Q76DRAFT_792247 [Earliella scabrosa]